MKAALSVRNLLPTGILTLLALLLYAPTANHGFVYDDEEYVIENPLLDEASGIEAIQRSLVEAHSANWHPLTWWTHMLDRAWFGLEPAGHHLVNVAWFTATVLLLYRALFELTGKRGASFFCALFFCVHPLRVESVAWVSERKDVVSGFFFTLTLLLYGRYARKRGALRYAALCVALLLGLLSKPMLVTLPCVLLLLDLWPLAPDKDKKPRRLVVEKLPLFALAAIGSVLTVWAQSKFGALSSVETMSIGIRVVNALDAYGFYIWKTLLPTGLAVIYPHPGLVESDPMAAIGLRAALWTVFLVAISIVVLRQRRKRPYLLVGWSWYLGMLVPVIGFVTVGAQAYADRYAYLPTIGLYLMLVFALAEALEKRPSFRRPIVAAGALFAMACAGLTWRQVAVWRSPQTLYEHAIALRAHNYVAHNNLGKVFLEEERYEEARSNLLAAQEIRPNFLFPQLNLAQLSRETGSLAEARRHIDRAIAIDGECFEAHAYKALILRDLKDLEGALQAIDRALALQPNELEQSFNRAIILTRIKRFGEAQRQYEALIASTPSFLDAHINLGNLFLRVGDRTSAVARFQAALRIAPASPQAQAGLGLALLQTGRTSEALDHLREALRIEPALFEVAQRLAWVLVTHADDALRAPREAMQLIERCLRVAGEGQPLLLETLAAAHAAGGDFAQAIAAQTRALAGMTGKRRQVAEGRLESYRRNEPLRLREAARNR